MINPCIIIPVYNHHQKIHAIIGRIADYKIPCIIVDDGSTSPCKDVLAELCEAQPLVTLLRSESNHGKGRAVCDGLRAAWESGYTHALQIDADGQHDLEDIPNFIEAIQQYPDALVTAVRIVKDAPVSRRWGRVITDVWVWINTLSFSIKDSMCGYRLYPLSSTIALLDKVSVGQRMDFDTDILVRLYWEGIEVRQISTWVIYDDDIPSHFKVLSDNVRISKMHAKLFFGMLIRLPRLILMNLRRI